MNLLDKIEKPSKHKGKLINLSEEDWNMLEAYRQYGSKKRGFEINLNTLIKQMVDFSIKKDKDFNHEEWKEKK
ncbi:MAG: hypothetical protein CMP11_03080 [Zetaproteobacteria bacterium]|nr:hypothetical protein [Pseudobdellovibrionaceae bacterium]|tara:strand:+ start:1738 stop:1956 length:219 start_codon:yes stop_codon:yes gene_type:complete